MTYESVSEEPVSFNSADERDVDFLNDSSEPSKNLQQLLNSPRSKYSNVANKPQPVENKDKNDAIAMAFSGMPKSGSVSVNLSKPSATGSRLLLKKTINKANDSTIDSTSMINQSVKNQPAVNTHINNIEELDKEPSPPDNSNKSSYPIPPIPTKQNESSTIPVNIQQYSNLNAQSGQSFSQGSSSFELFTKMPPVPIPPQNDGMKKISNEQPAPSNTSTSGKISVQIKPKFLQKKAASNASKLPQQSEVTPPSEAPSNLPSTTQDQQPEKLEQPIQGKIPVKIKVRTASSKQTNLNTQPTNQASQLNQSQITDKTIDQQNIQLTLNENLISKEDNQITLPSNTNLGALPSEQIPNNLTVQPVTPPQQTGISQIEQQQIPQPAQQPMQPVQPPIQQQIQQPIQQQAQQSIKQPVQPPIQQQIQQPIQQQAQQSMQQQVQQPIQQQVQQPIQQQAIPPQPTESLPISQQVPKQATPLNVQQVPNQNSIMQQQILQNQTSIIPQQPAVQPIVQQPNYSAQISPVGQNPYQNENAINGPLNYSPLAAQQPEVVPMNGIYSNLPNQQQIPQQFSPPIPQQPGQYQMQSNIPTNAYQPFSISPASYTNVSAPQLSPIYTDSTFQQQQKYVSTPPSIYVRTSPTSAVEQRFSASLDRSITSLRRYFSTEFSMMMRQMSSSTAQQGMASGTGVDFDFDEYSQSVSSEVSKIIESPVTSLDVNYTVLSKQIGQIIDNQTKPLTSILSESSSKQKSIEQLRSSELQQLQQELESIQGVIQTNADAILKELEKERQNSATLNKAHIAKQNEIEQRLRSVKLKQVELEAQSLHQNVEQETLEKQLKQLENRRREWEDKFHEYDRSSQGGMFLGDDSFIDNFDATDPYSTGRLRQQIIDEINDLRKQLDHDAFEEMTRNIQEGISAIRSESDNMRTELVDIEMANMWVMSQIQNRNATTSFVQYPQNASLMAQTFVGNTIMPPSPVKSPQNSEPSSPMIKAQMRLDQWRKQRQEVVRKVKEEIQ